MNNSEHREGFWHTRVTKAGVFLGFLLVLFGAPLVHLANYAAHNELNSHILVVPFISAYLLHIRKANLPEPSRPAVGWVAFSLILGLFLWLMAVSVHAFGGILLNRNDQLSLFALSFVAWVWGGGFLLLGGRWMRAAAFPMLFLLFMVPLPTAVVDTLESASKLASAQVAEWFYVISGTAFLRDNNVFQLPGLTLEVAQECSGIRSSYILILTSLLAANLFLMRTWSRILLVVFVVPLGIIRNAFRIWVISMLCIHINPQMIHSVIHQKGGPLFFLLSLPPLFLFLFWLRKIELGQRAGAGKQTSSAAAKPTVGCANLRG